jgi:rRNA maturation protein Rpf1
MASESYMSMGQKSRGRVGVKENFRERRGHKTFENLFSDL